MLSILPKELIDLTWSCRAPQKIGNEYVKCGLCPSCREVAIVQGRLEKSHFKCMSGGI
jgi:7-cyano-7-deazaguanine synthase in queuosine biosynthesis